MQSNTHIILNMQAPNVAVVVNAKQGDKLSRVITADLVDGDIPFIPPSGVAAAVRYFKPDNTIGFYDVTEDGAAAIVLDGSTATVTLAEQALTVPGNVYAEINFYTSNEKLTTFNFIIHVQKSAVSDQMIESTDYFSVLTEKINAILGAAVNPPYINPDNKHWMLWSETAGAYVDSGYSSIGLVPPSTVTYQAGTSGTTPPAGTWATTIPTVPQGAYLWTRTQFEFSDGTQQVSYSVARQGLDGTGSVRTVNENSPDENGNVYVMTVNPNLLDNWYFANPVNQRGQTSYTSEGYTIDRWCIRGSASATVNSGVVTIRRDGSETGSWHTFSQIVELDLYDIKGKTLCFSAFVESAAGDFRLVFADGTFTTQSGLTIPAGTRGVVSHKWKVTESLSGNLVVTFFTSTADVDIKISAAKLELGDTQTLAHQESSGNWVLNEIPNYGEQLAKCQRYQQLLPIAEATAPIAPGYAESETSIRVSIPLPVKMRTKPSLEYLLGSIGYFDFVGEGGLLRATAIATYETENSAIAFVATTSGATPKCVYSLCANSSALKVLLNANL